MVKGVKNRSESPHRKDAADGFSGTSQRKKIKPAESAGFKSNWGFRSWGNQKIVEPKGMNSGGDLVSRAVKR